MDGSKVLRRFYKERKTWLAGRIPGDAGNEIRWVVRGIDLCIRHTRDVLKEAREMEFIRKPKISRWISRELYHAIDLALKHLGKMERSKAVLVLENARDYARRDHDNRLLHKTPRIPQRVGQRDYNMPVVRGQTSVGAVDKDSRDKA